VKADGMTKTDTKCIQEDENRDDRDRDGVKANGVDSDRRFESYQEKNPRGDNGDLDQEKECKKLLKNRESPEADNNFVWRSECGQDKGSREGRGGGGSTFNHKGAANLRTAGAANRRTANTPVGGAGCWPRAYKGAAGGSLVYPYMGTGAAPRRTAGAAKRGTARLAPTQGGLV
jgi:hypothetical protein